MGVDPDPCLRREGTRSACRRSSSWERPRLGGRRSTGSIEAWGGSFPRSGNGSVLVVDTDDVVAGYARLHGGRGELGARARRQSVAHVGGRGHLTGAQRHPQRVQRQAAGRPTRVRPHLHPLLLARCLAGGRRAPAAGASTGRDSRRHHPRRLDLGSPVGTAWELAQAWPDAELLVIGDSGHTGSDAMREAALAATERFKPT